MILALIQTICSLLLAVSAVVVLGVLATILSADAKALWAKAGREVQEHEHRQQLAEQQLQSLPPAHVDDEGVLGWRFAA